MTSFGHAGLASEEPPCFIDEVRTRAKARSVAMNRANMGTINLIGSTAPSRVARAGVCPLPPKGYLERIREIATRHGVLLIFDEVITGFGRLGAPFASDYFGVIPELMTTAKALTNGAVPMGAVFCARTIHDAMMQGPEDAIELFHGYTYSGHPIACAAGLVMLDICAEEGLLTRAACLAQAWREAVGALRASPLVIDIRTIGPVSGIELAPRPGAAGARAHEVFVKCFERGLLIRVTGDVIALSPPLILNQSEIEMMVSTLSECLRDLS